MRLLTYPNIPDFNETGGTGGFETFILYEYIISPLIFKFALCGFDVLAGNVACLKVCL